MSSNSRRRMMEQAAKPGEDLRRMMEQAAKTGRGHAPDDEADHHGK